MMRQKIRLILAALSVVLLSCQSTRFEEDVVVDDQNFTMALSVPRASLRPDSVAWSTPRQKGRTPVLPSSTAGAQIEVSIHLDKPIGSDTLKLDVWKSTLRIGSQAYVLQGDGLVKVSATRDTMACKILDTLASLNAEFPLRYPLGKDSSIAKVMARLVVEGDPSFATWQEKFPAGVDTARMRRDALVYAATSGQSLSSLAAAWSLGMDATSAKVAIQALVPKYIAAADTVKLFPKTSLRLVVPVSVAGDVYPDSSSVSVRGRYASDSRLMGPSVRVLKNGVEDRGHFVIEQRGQPGASTSIWDLEFDGGVKVKALGSASPGTYTLVVVMEDEIISDTTRVSFSVLARAKTDPIDPNPLVAHDTLLKQLMVSEGSLTPSFSPTRKAYTDTLENSVKSVVIQGVPADSTDEVFVSIGASFAKADGTPILLAEGMVTTATLRVKNVNGGVCDYVIGLYRKPRPVAHDTTLKSLVVSSGTLVPGFSPATFRYVDTVENAVGSVTVAGVPADITDTVFVSSGGAFVKADGAPVSLTEGVVTTVTLRVKNVNARWQDYVIGVYRKRVPQPLAAEGWNTAIKYGTFKDDRDGQSYWTVKIGSQTWMAQNLNYAGASGNTGMCPAAEGSKSQGSKDSCAKYGRLYYWDEAADRSATGSDAVPSGLRGICPTGWHLPSRSEWTQLSSGMLDISVEGSLLKSRIGWASSGNGTDDFGFRVLPAGFINRDMSGNFSGIGKIARFWTSSLDLESCGVSCAYHEAFEAGKTGVSGGNIIVLMGVSVRCVQD